MKHIEIDNELYDYIAANTQQIGESASDILRRLLQLPVVSSSEVSPVTISHPSLDVNQARPLVAQSAPTVVPVRSAVAESGVFAELLEDEQLDRLGSAVARFLYLLDVLYRQHPQAFAKVLQVRGRGRLYFSQSADELLNASASAKPKQIGTSAYWVTTNNNTQRKRSILSAVLDCLGCQAELADSIVEKI